MRKTAYILIIIILQLTSCKKSTIAETENYIESKPSFFELHNENWLTNKWIRKPENLLIIHETFKKVGYNDLIGTYLSDNPLIIQDLYINKNGNNILDSLLITYKENEKGTKYYTEFWARRKKEKNNEIVYQILLDIKYSLKHKLSSAELQFNVDNSKVNDTLKSLLEIEYRNEKLSSKLAIENFEMLKKLGFHQSAYNLLFERAEYENVKWNKDSLVKTLKVNKTNLKPWFEDNEK